MGICGVSLHVLLWVINAPILFCSCITEVHERRSCFFLASLKDLGFSLAIISGFPRDAYKAPGLMAIPVVFGFLLEIFMDSMLIMWWARHPSTVDEVCTTQTQVN